MASPFRTKNFISYYLDIVDVQYAYITRPIVQLHNEIQDFVRETLCDVYILCQEYHYVMDNPWLVVDC